MSQNGSNNQFTQFSLSNNLNTLVDWVKGTVQGKQLHLELNKQGRSSLLEPRFGASLFPCGRYFYVTLSN